MRAANSNGEDSGGAASNCDKAEGRRFIAAVMAISTADDMIAEGDVQGGIVTYRKAIEICPLCDERGSFQVVLGGILFEQGDAAGAAALLRAALADGCLYPYEASRRLSFAHAAQGDFAAARQAMSGALESGEDAAFATQALVIYDLALHGLDAALQTAEPSPKLAGAQTEYRCRLALVRAELQRLAGNRAAALSNLELAVETAREDALEIELALWLAVLDRHFGRAGLRPEIAAAFAAQPDHWAYLAWKILTGDGTREDLVHHLDKMAPTLQAENLAIFDRFAGLQAEAAGDLDTARASFTAARKVLHTQWCIDYHLAGIGLQRLGSIP